MNYSRPWMYAGLAMMAAGALMLYQQQSQPSARAEPPKTPAADPVEWKDLFDGRTLTGWKAPQFGGEGKVYVKDGMIVMEMGSMMTGVTWTAELTPDNYAL